MISFDFLYSIRICHSMSVLQILLKLVEYTQTMSKQTAKICKRCKTEYYEETGYPVCDYCLSLLDNWE